MNERLIRCLLCIVSMHTFLVVLHITAMGQGRQKKGFASLDFICLSKELLIRKRTLLVIMKGECGAHKIVNAVPSSKFVRFF